MIRSTTARAVVLACVLLGIAGCDGTDPNVWTQHNDNARTGAYLAEGTLTPQAVRNRGMKIKYWLRPCNGQVVQRETPPVGCIDGAVLSQPLFVKNVPFGLLGGSTADGAFLSTSKNIVYALDADTGKVMWQTPPLTGTAGATSFARGINAAPVIDVANQRMYVAYGLRNLQYDWPLCDESGADADRRRNTLQGEYWLAALDLRNGNHVRAPVKISGAVATAARTIARFNGRAQNQHVALLLDRGSVYVAFGSMAHVEACVHDYHGWVMRYDAATLQQQSVFCTSCDSSPEEHKKNGGAGIWQAGGGLAADADGHVYFLTGNGLARSTLGGARQDESLYGDAFVKLRRYRPFLEPVSHLFGATGPPVYFPPEAKDDQEFDADFGSGGAAVIPGTGVVIGGGKSGYMYVLNRSDMTLRDTITATTNQYNNDPNLRTKTWDKGPHLHGSPTYWRGPNPERGAVYVWGEKDVLRRYPFNLATETIESATAITAPVRALWRPMPGGMISVSANGNTAGSAIVWATLPVSEGEPPYQGYLYAFDAETLQFLWNTGYGLSGHWAPPTIAAGKVFITSGRDWIPGSENLIVYELGPADGSRKSGDQPYQPTQRYCKFCHNSGRMIEQMTRLVSMSDHFRSGGEMSAAPSSALSALPVPEDQQVSAVLYALGERAYEAQRDADGQRYAWRLKDSSASLSGDGPEQFDSRQPPILGRFASELSWVAEDNSAMTLEPLATARAPMHTDSEWALFRAVRSSETGLLGGTTYVRRVFTHAGSPPADPPGHAGEIVRVPYYAEYWLYRGAPRPFPETPGPPR